ncbi:MAG: tRNA pseudouridine(13) synthase TruD [Desulfobacteraceae bacterium]|nr:tRNA pseudouridine(13) synthase TruD [Desulfobacteraceae bacterium]
MDLDAVREKLTSLPMATSDLTGIGGRIKTVPEHFQVEEILAYRACGIGEHVYATLRRKGWNTPDVGREIARTLGVPSRDVGWAGLKDRNALTTQTFSIRLLQKMSRAEVAKRLRVDTPFEILAVERHRNKLKPGHVQANRFRIWIAGVRDDAQERAAAIAEQVGQTGIPNFFGEQRFGHRMANLERADALVRSTRRRRHRKDAFFVSVLQSALFNVWLAERMERGDFQRILTGDIAKKTDTGGLFTVEEPDLQDALDRFCTGKIVYTGPMYGYKIMKPTKAAGRIEADLLRRFGLTPESFRPWKSPGTRRPGLLRPEALQIESVSVPGGTDPTAESETNPRRAGVPPSSEPGLLFSFTLSAGCYATMLLREFMKS